MLLHNEILNPEFNNIDFIRNYKKFLVQDNIVKIFFQDGKMELSFFKYDIVKVFIGDIYEKSKDTLAIYSLPKSCLIDVCESEARITVKGENICTIINKENLKISFISKNGNVLCEDFKPCGRNGKNIFIAKSNDCTAYYGFGEKGGSLNKKGQYIENFNTDNSFHDDDTPLLYKTIPFYIGVKQNDFYGIYFDNSFRSYFDMGKSFKDFIYFGAAGGKLQYYFMPGKDIKDVVKKYALLTGTMDMPAAWSLGYQQCRYSYNSQNEVETLAETFRNKQIPCDTIYLDIDYMDRYKVMTFNTESFPEPSSMIKKLKENGFNVVTILDPGVKVEENYEVYENGIKGDHFVKKADGSLFQGEVWPGLSAFPDFANENTRKWWKNELKNFLSLGISGIWNDMNEAAVFDNEYKTLPETCLHNGDDGVMDHSEFHNMYGMQMSRCSKEAQEESRKNTRSFSMTRATFAGGQRYSSIWTGDNHSTWQHMRMSIPMNCNLGISGFAYVGNDVGGFADDCSEELFIRWIELGTFLPIFRNHSSIGTRRQEPWCFGARAEAVLKKFIELRYNLMPYLYNQYYKAHKEGIPIMRPMIMEYPEDANVIDMYSQFMFGDDILVAPVLYEGEREKLVYLPNGKWYDHFTHKEYKGARFYNLNVPLENTVVFVKEGSIIPIYEEKYNYVGEKELEITLEVFKGIGSLEFYEDDGISFDYKRGGYNLYRIESKNDTEQKVDINAVHKGLESTRKFNIKYI